jgi:hypothetical protein
MRQIALASQYRFERYDTPFFSDDCIGVDRDRSLVVRCPYGIKDNDYFDIHSRPAAGQGALGKIFTDVSINAPRAVATSQQFR